MTRRAPDAPGRDTRPDANPVPTEPVRVAVGVAAPPHGVADRVRLSALVPHLLAAGVSLRPWSQPSAARPAGVRPSVDDPGTLLWSDVVWVRRHVNASIPDDQGRLAPSGFDPLLEAYESHPDVLAGRRVVYDIDVDLTAPRPETLAAGADAAQVGRLLALADVVTVPSERHRRLVAAQVPDDRIVVTPSLVTLPDGMSPVRPPTAGRPPVVAWIDMLDGPGGVEPWLSEIIRRRGAGESFRLVRLADPAAREVEGFDEVVRADEGTDAWLEALLALAPDVVLAPSLADAFAEFTTDLAWREATLAGAAVIADGRPAGPYAHLVDGRDAVLVGRAEAAAAAVTELVAAPGRRLALVGGARSTLAAGPTPAAVGCAWADAFRHAVDLPARRPTPTADAAFARRHARRVMAAAPLPRQGAKGAATVGLAGIASPDGMAAALDAACRLAPPPVEIVLAGPSTALAAVRRAAADAPGGCPALRLLETPPDASPGEALGAAVAATRASWLGILDATAELRPGALGELVAAARDNDLDAVFGALTLAGRDGSITRLGGWPPSSATCRGSALVVAGATARALPPPCDADPSDPALDWLLLLMEAGCRTGSADVHVARWLPPDARTTRIASTGVGVPYADGGEDRLLGIIGAAVDRSSTSDELARSIGDWTSRYHLSRLRGNIVASVSFPPRARVIDVGAGTGTIARALGERGLQVVALEGSFDRARVAAVRCSDLPGVSVVHGTVGEYEAPGEFDAVVVIGVLEYSGSFNGGAAGPEAFLGRVRRLLRPDGVLVLAIENRFGLKYLQGYAEDHLGRPWVGVDGYPGSNGIRTWSRRVLGGMLREAGLCHQRWRYPFPDYKLPTVVVDERAYREPDAAQLVDALVRQPIQDYANPRTLARDDRAAHVGMLEAGMGEDVANSFLVIASADAGSVERYAPADGPLAWLFGDERASRWLRVRTVRAGAHGREVVMERGAEEVEAHGLRQVRPTTETFVVGPTLEQEVKQALAQGGLAAAKPVLAAWRQAIAAEARASRAADAGNGGNGAGGGRGAVGPGFAAPGSRPALPGGMVDVVLPNFIRTPAGITRIDREWRVDHGVERDVALFRALWQLASSITFGVWAGPWPVGAPIVDVARDLAAAAGIEVDDALLERFRASEGWLQRRVLRDEVAPAPGASG